MSSNTNSLTQDFTTSEDSLLNINSLNLNNDYLLNSQNSIIQDENNLINGYNTNNNILNSNSNSFKDDNNIEIDNIVELSDYKKILLNFIIDQNNKIINLLNQ